ncbi:hypothetical protein ABS71_01970 [bacterium SCN 62-11]|nr:DUF72 domain-containing protein [Candidatus Eremiobacteraeota bacterium]ODT78287.1 MAG: hypothetical protein ABS71_01970 [bacterium SCN 62-11]
MQLSLFERPEPLLGAFEHPNLRLGTASWNYPGWRGLVYDEPGLAAYSAHPLFRCVALDRNFYGPLSEAEYAGYAAQVPANFRFLVKAPRALVDPASAHYLDAPWALENFLEPARRGLGSSLGLAHFFFPPARHDDFRAFFGRLLEVGCEVSYEVRQKLVCDLPALNRVWNVFPGMDWPQPEKGGVRVVRWTLRPSAPEVPWNLKTAAHRYLPFSALRDPDVETRRRIADQVLDWLGQGLPVWVLVNNKAEGCAPLSLRMLTEELALRSS